MKREALSDNLRTILCKKSYLVVLDDVWKEQDIHDILKALPTTNNTRSKIIITSRHLEIVKTPELKVYTYKAQDLSEVDGWKLFSKIISLAPGGANYEEFETLGKEMLTRCGGLPLAIVALAGILRKKGTIAEWLKVKKAVQSKVMEAAITQGSKSSNVKRLIALSYDDLPRQLQHCFLYLGICPGDSEISTGIVTRMWIAEGFVTGQGDVPPEDVAMQHFVELSSRFMIQVVRTNLKGEIKKFRLHDLLRDLCINIAKEQRFLENYPPLNIPTQTTSIGFTVHTRRIALHSSMALPKKYKHLWALVVLKRLSISNSASVPRETMDVNIACVKFKFLRVLNLWGIESPKGTLPDEIGKLFFLGYLSIRFTNITKLPISIGNLRNLLTLDYRNIDSGNRVATAIIPSALSKLEGLRHLFLPIDCPWRIEELKLSGLSQLQTLWGVKQQEQVSNDWLSREMAKSSASMKKLKIVVSSLDSLKAAFSCPSLMSDTLHTFHCEMRGGVALQDVELLNQRGLLKLILIESIQMDISLAFPTSLVMLELKDSMLREDIDPMAALGKMLTHLKFLRLINSYTGTSITCGPDSFPMLEQLYLAKLENLEIWNIERGAMPCLEKLEIITCRKLYNVPEGLAFITTIQQFEYFDVPSEFRERAKVLGRTRGLRLPHNCEAILEQSDSSVDISSVHMLPERLTSGVFLHNKSKRYWVRKRHGCYNNCFFVYVKDLRIICADGSLYSKQNDMLEKHMPPTIKVYDPDLNATSANEDRFYKWCEMVDSDEEMNQMITAIKVNPEVLSFEALGRFNTGNLSPEVTYEIAYEIMLEGLGHGWKMHVACELTLPNGITKNRTETLNDKPRDQWVRVLVGEFKTSPEFTGDVGFSFHIQQPRFWKVGLFIKGVIIEPKL